MEKSNFKELLETEDKYTEMLITEIFFLAKNVPKLRNDELEKDDLYDFDLPELYNLWVDLMEKMQCCNHNTLTNR